MNLKGKAVGILLIGVGSLILGSANNIKRAVQNRTEKMLTKGGRRRL